MRLFFSNYPILQFDYFWAPNSTRILEKEFSQIELCKIAPVKACFIWLEPITLEWEQLDLSETCVSPPSFLYYFEQSRAL